MKNLKNSHKKLDFKVFLQSNSVKNLAFDIKK